MRAQLLEQIAAARQLGHDVDLELLRVPVSKNLSGVASQCTCGWRSSPKSKPIKAIGAAMVHVGMVVGEGEAHPVVDQVPDDVPRRVGA